MAADRLPDPRLGVQLAGSATAAAGAHKAIGPARFEQVFAARLIGKVQLKLDEGAGNAVTSASSSHVFDFLFLAADAFHHD
jgi:hypothetical protein